MNHGACRELADLLPEYAAGGLAAERGIALERHLEACPECAAELALVRTLAAGRPAVPAELGARITAAARVERAGGPGAAPGRLRPGRRRFDRLRPVWALPAAAAAVLALGTALLRDPDPTSSGLGEVSIDDPSELWLAEEGVVAGAPVLDQLSDETLVILLEELEG